MLTTDSELPTWHTSPVEEVLTRLATTTAGLSGAEATQQLTTHGPNELRATAHTSAWRTFAAQFENVLILILLAATAVSGFLGHTLEAIVITVIVLFAVLLGFIQEHRASRALEALKKMAAPLAHVLRDALETSVPARELVPGDVILLRAGDRVPADVRVLQAVNLAIDEAALTGKSVAVEKTEIRLDDEQLSLGDRRNMAYAGTLVARGRGQAVVVATGMTTEFGRIAQMVETVEVSRTSCKLISINSESHARQGRTLSGRGRRHRRHRPRPAGHRHVPLGIALAVAAVPEALPAVVTISLAIGLRRMVKRNYPRSATADRRNAGQHVGHLFRQDGHTDAERNDRPAGVRRRLPVGVYGSWLRASRQGPRQRTDQSSRRRVCARCCGLACSRPTRSSCPATHAGMSWEIQPKALSSSRQPRWG